MISKQNKLSIIETCILLQLYKEYPKLLHVKDLVDDVSLLPYIKKGCKSLVDKGLVIKRDKKYVVIEYLSLIETK